MIRVLIWQHVHGRGLPGLSSVRIDWVASTSQSAASGVIWIGESRVNGKALLL